MSLGATQCDPSSPSNPDPGSTHSEASNPLLTAFQSGCSGGGPWTQTAIKNTRALQSVFQQIAENSACKPLLNRLAAIQSYTQSINQLLSDQDFQTLRIKEESLKQLTLALSTTTDPTTQATLQTAIANLQVDLAKARASSMVSDSTFRKGRLELFSNDLTDYSQALLSDTAQLQACLHESPGASIEIATNLIAMSGSLVSPVIGAGSRLIGQLINFGVESARTRGPEDQIWSLYESEMPTALTCGLESMTEFACEASDTAEILDQIVRDEEPSQGKTPNPARSNLELYADDMPGLIHWLRELRNGLPAGDRYDSDRTNDAVDLRIAIEKEERAETGEIKKLTRKYFSEPDLITRQNLYVSFLKTVASHAIAWYEMQSYGGSSRHPALEQLTSDPRVLACWLSFGYGDLKCKKMEDAPGGVNSTYFEKYVRENLLDGMDDKVRQLEVHWNGIAEAAMTLANSDYFDAYSIDVRALLQKGREDSKTKKSPRQVFQQIADFMNEMKANPKTPEARGPLILDTLNLVQEALRILDLPDPKPDPHPTTPNAADQPFRERIAQLYELLHLREGTEYISQRVGNLVLWDLNDRLSRGELKGKLGEILAALGGDLRARLLAPGNSNITSVIDDLTDAHRLTTEDIDSFIAGFQGSLGKAVQKLAENSAPPKEPAEGAFRPNGQLLGKLCGLILASSKDGSSWPDSVSWEACSRASYYYPGDPNKTLMFTVADLKRELDSSPDQSRKNRLCVYHRFIRKTRIREILNELNAKKSEPSAFSGVSLLNWFGF